MGSIVPPLSLFEVHLKKEDNQKAHGHSTGAGGKPEFGVVFRLCRERMFHQALPARLVTGGQSAIGIQSKVCSSAEPVDKPAYELADGAGSPAPKQECAKHFFRDHQ